jgi:hypothetical protein
LAALRASPAFESSFPPGCVTLGILLGEYLSVSFIGLGYGGCDEPCGLGVVVEEGPGARAAGDCGDAHPDLLVAQQGDCVADSLDGGLGVAAVGGQGGRRAVLGIGRGVHAQASPEASSATLWLASRSALSLPVSARSVARKAVDQTR